MRIEIEAKEYDAIIEAIESFALDNEPNIIVEDHGIGSYEYWGFKGYDSRKRAIIDGNDDVHIFVVSPVDSDGEPFEVSDFEREVNIEVTHESDFDDLEITVKFDLKVAGVENGLLIVKGQWIEKG